MEWEGRGETAIHGSTIREVSLHADWGFFLPTESAVASECGGWAKSNSRWRPGSAGAEGVCGEEAGLLDADPHSVARGPLLKDGETLL